MDLLRHENLRSLIEPAPGPCVSIFLPTHRGGVETKQGAIRLKNQIKQTEEQLSRQGRRGPEITELLAPLRELCENGGFWQQQSDGLAIFRAPGKFFHYRVPLHFDELLVITDRFHVKPLLRLFAEDGRYYLLSLSKNEIRFFQCTRYGARQLRLPEGTPLSLNDVLELAGVENQLQMHSAGATARFHGHGAKAQDDKDNLREFFRLVDRGVKETVGDDRAPLVLAGVEYLFPLYREANTHPRLIDGGVAGNPEGRPVKDLQSDAWAAVEPHFRQARESAAKRYTDYTGTAKTSNRVDIVVPAACQGRVEQLFVAVGKQVWGQWDEETQEVTLSDQKVSGDRDLLNLAAVQGLLQGGAVYAVAPDEVPGGGLLAAVFRY